MTSCTQNTAIEDIILKCSDCLGRLRKIEELEGIISCKNDILNAQQNQLQNYETNYKKLFDDFEQLRLDLSHALQYNFSLKEINSKLEQYMIEQKNIALDAGQKKLFTIVNSDNQRLIESAASKERPLFQEFSHIETLIKTQNHTFHKLIEKIVREINLDKSDSVAHNKEESKEKHESREAGDTLVTNPNIEKLTAEIEKQKILIEEAQNENKRIKNILTEKRSKLIHSVSNIVDIKAIMEPHKIIKQDEQTLTLNIDDPELPNIIINLKIRMEKQAEHFEKCTCKLVEQLEDAHDSNQVLADTLAIVTQENKNNLQMIANLKIELKKAHLKCDNKTCVMNKQISRIENELEETKIVEKSLKKSVDLSEKELQKLQDELKNATEENCLLKDCKCAIEQEYRANLAERADEINELRKELTEKNLELAEYEEENRHYCQKIEALNKQNNDLTNKIKESENIKEVKSKAERSIQTSSSYEMELKLKQLEIDKHSLACKCKELELDLDEKASDLERFNSSTKRQLEELDKLVTENDKLKKEIEQVKRDNQLETEKLQESVAKSQKLVAKLLEEHDEKSNEIEHVAKELNNIRRSVSEDNEKYLEVIKQLEQERENLKIDLKQYEEHDKTCTCGVNQELDRLKYELTKKQVMILELEKSVDNFNETLKNFEKTIEDLANENSILKSDRDNRVKELETLQVTLSEKINELEEIRKQLGNSNTNKLELENDLLKIELEELKKDKRKIERGLLENYQREMEVESMKEEHQRRQSLNSEKIADLQKAYEELKYLFDRKEKENEKLRNDNMKSEAEKVAAEKKCECLSIENKKLKVQSGLAVEEICSMKEECDQLRKTCAKKCFEIEALKDNIQAELEERRICKENCEGLKKKQAESEIELFEMREKLDELLKKYQDKSEELKKINKQYESCAKQSKISREEYSKLRKEYKEIKSMLSDQLRKYRKDGEKEETKQPCDLIKDARRKLMDKEMQIEQLQQKLKDSSYEIIELKDYIHKLISDNNALKSGINNLIENLERKIKGGPSFGSLPGNSAEAIAGEILNSLSNIENIITKNGDICPKGCGTKNCDCMNEITSQYSFKDPSKVQSESLSLYETSIQYGTSKTKAKTLYKSPLELSGVIRPEPSRETSETNTTDSDDHNNTDRQSLEFFKDAIVDLRSRIGKTMKEKSCDCEEFFAENPKKHR